MVQWWLVRRGQRRGNGRGEGGGTDSDAGCRRLHCEHNTRFKCISRVCVLVPTPLSAVPNVPIRSQPIRHGSMDALQHTEKGSPAPGRTEREETHVLLTHIVTAGILCFRHAPLAATPWNVLPSHPRITPPTHRRARAHTHTPPPPPHTPTRDPRLTGTGEEANAPWPHPSPIRPLPRPSR